MTDVPVDKIKLERIASAVTSLLARVHVEWIQYHKSDNARRELSGLKEAENASVREAAGLCLVALALAVEKNPEMLLAIAPIEKHVAP